MPALILSWWLNVTADSTTPFPTSLEYVESLRALEGLFHEIFEELGDQGVCCDFSKVHPASPPLVFYRMLMQKWVWTCKSAIVLAILIFMFESLSDLAG